MQLAVVEFSRNVLGWRDANSTEFDPTTSHPVVVDMPEHNPGQMGGTMRLGKRRTLFQTKNSVMRKLYGDADYLEERHRHRFEVNPVWKKCLEEQGLKFVGQDVEGERMEIVELEDHPFLLVFSTTLSSCPDLSSPPHHTLASSWPLWGGSRITSRKAAGSHPGTPTVTEVEAAPLTLKSPN